jgi:hypothetical protein
VAQIVSKPPPPPAPAAAAAPLRAATPAAPPPPPLSDQIAPLVYQLLLHPSCKEVRQQAAASLQLLHPRRGEQLPILVRLLPRACAVGKAGKQFFLLLEGCLGSGKATADDGGSPSIAAASQGAGSPGLAAGQGGSDDADVSDELSPGSWQEAAEAIGYELRQLAERLLTQQEVEGSNLVNAGAHGFTLGRLVQMLQIVLGGGSSGDGEQQPAAESGEEAATQLELPPQLQQRLLRQVLWCVSALEALSIGRTSATKAAGRQLEQLLQDRWMSAGGGGSSGARWEVARAASELLETLQPAVAAGGGGAATAAAAAAAIAATAAPDAAATAPWLQHLCEPLLARLCACVCPERVAPVYTLQLIKAPTQQDFIPGSIGGGGLVSAAEVGGPLMRDVKNFVCRRLDMEGEWLIVLVDCSGGIGCCVERMLWPLSSWRLTNHGPTPTDHPFRPGLISDDFGMELLVSGSLIDLSLPVAAVYTRVWQAEGAGGRGGARRGGAGGAMAVTYR